MVVFLSFVGLILCIMYLFFIFVGREKTYSIIIRLVCACMMIMINVFRIPMEISMNQSYTSSIFMIALWIINVVMASIELGNIY